MTERYLESIIKFLAARPHQVLKPRELARLMGVSDEDYGTFRGAMKRLRDEGRLVLGAQNALTLPDLPVRFVGVYSAHPRGFGFVKPEMPTAHGDLFIPAGYAGGALTGDRVEVHVSVERRRGRPRSVTGAVTRVLARSRNRFVGTLEHAGETWFVLPDGSQFVQPIVVKDAGTARASAKVVVEIVKYGREGELSAGVIVETLGLDGELAAETRAVMRAYDFPEEFGEEALADARAAVDRFDPGDLAGREDLTGAVVITIDPPDARDFDDALSLADGPDGTVILGVHIADVSHFVCEGTALDAEARARGTSVYFPRRVVPMLPEILSNSVCSLQEGEVRFTKSVFITYDAGGAVVGSRVAETTIRSAKRLTYREAQAVIDGATEGYDPRVAALLSALESLCRRIEARRRDAGMLHLDLPQIELVFDENDKVVDAEPSDDAYTHTMIEMCMVEANEQAAAFLQRRGCAFLRRIHPPPEALALEQLGAFTRALGFALSPDQARAQLQDLLRKAHGRPESYAVNLAVLRTFQQAEYSPREVGHFALASALYTHFTSPIRRYSDLTVHRLIERHCRGARPGTGSEDMDVLTALGDELSVAERRAEAAEMELREVLVLGCLEKRLGEEFDGVVTGVTNFGIFVQSPRFLIEGLIRMEDLGDDWWEVDARHGLVRGERTGRTFRMGQVLRVCITAVDPPRRRLSLQLVKKAADGKEAPAAQKRRKKGAPRRGRKARSDKPRVEKPRNGERRRGRPKRR